jgi:hypothetical protein
MTPDEFIIWLDGFLSAYAPDLVGITAVSHNIVWDPEWDKED